MDAVVAPSLHPTSSQFTTIDTDLAAYLYAENLLELVSWDLAPNGRSVEFKFDDPDGLGVRIQREFFNSPSYRMLSARRYLSNKVNEVLRPSGRR